jgi:hypothetical protein
MSSSRIVATAFVASVLILGGAFVLRVLEAGSLRTAVAVALRAFSLR